MRKVYYNPTQELTLLLLVFVSMCPTPRACAAQQQSSLKASALESHEGMTISARPWMTVLAMICCG